MSFSFVEMMILCIGRTIRLAKNPANAFPTFPEGTAKMIWSVEGFNVPVPIRRK
jgi:hypothetical protein